ncbi:MAG: hypothetical protein LBL84_03550 [Candidatus Nomurabacteria bacterium]|nr:hypothetical protein [Candidatus Nomurabacteria bacterium]
MNKPKGKEDDNITQANAIALATANGDKKCDDDGKGGGGKDEPKGKSKKAGGRYSHLDDVKDDIERANADYLKAVTFGDTMAAMADAFKKAMHS